ncbi:hypothetical protein PHYBOEH_004509 [Phytophthora boehmeriae]|uniref:C2H2-type domain-containing protein n=1 Tax=Phytophthora boehmeriae TaxID=109152 RepID=A0A8T1WNB9_9STRA|nr:hypothetical protein PHYBOEH_004509 [Phytophthora boehmeriae]
MKRSHKNLNVPFECPRCLLAFKKKSDLQAHSYVHTGVMPFECEDCGVRFLKKFLLTRHQRTHAARRESETQVLVCECQEICFSAEELQKHKQTAHAKDEKVDGKDEEIIDVCMNEGVQDDDVEMKESTDVKMEQAGSSSLLCRVCDRTFQRKQTLRMHLRTHFESLDERKEFVCPMPGCNKAYTRKSNLMTHYNAVHDERKSRRFACPREGCSARFGYKTTLTRHIDKVHDNPKPPKRRERSSAGILARALGVNQVGEDASRTNSSGGDEGATSASKVAQTQDPATIVQEVLETLCTTVAAANV